MSRGVVWFLVICFGVAWTSWEIAIATGVSVLSSQFQLYALPGAFAPAIAALVVRKWITREGFADADLGLQAARWRYYLIAWLLPLAVVAAIVLEAMFLGIARPDFSLSRAVTAGYASPALSGHGWLIVPQLMITAVLATPVLWGEEFGWRGYLQKRLFVGRPVAAAIATGLIWGVWHYPVTLRGYNYPDHPFMGSLIFPIFTVLIAYILGWIRGRSGSVWASSLAHAATNSIGALALLWLAGAQGPFVVSYAGLLALPPLAVVCLCIFKADKGNSLLASAGPHLKQMTSSSP
jgi:membrane protease YdiL (CAAX protease family)